MGYRLCVTAEVVTMMIPLHTKTGEFKKKKKKKKKLLLQFQRTVCCEVVMHVPPGIFRAAEQTTKRSCFRAWREGFALLSCKRKLAAHGIK